MSPQGKLHQATHLLDQLHPETSQPTPASRRHRAALYLERARVAWYRGKTQLALSHQGRALTLSQEAQAPFLVIQAHSLAGLLALNQGQAPEAIVHLDKALEQAQGKNLALEVAVQWNNLGHAYLATSNLKKAEHAFHQALKIDKDRQQRRGQAFDLRNLGLLARKAGDPQRTRTLFEQALALSRATHAIHLQIQLHLALGDLKARDQPKETAIHYREALGLAEKGQMDTLTWQAYAALAKNFRSTDPHQALAYYDESIRILGHLAKEGSSGALAGIDTIQVQAPNTIYQQAILLAYKTGEVETAYKWHQAQGHRGWQLALGSEASKVWARKAARRVSSQAMPAGHTLIDIAMIPHNKRIQFLLFIQDHGKMHVAETMIPEAQWQHTMTTLRGNMATLNPTPDELQTIADWLLAPIQPLLPASHTLHWILPPAMQGIPLAALPFNSKQLLDSHNLIMWPHRQLITHTQSKGPALYLSQVEAQAYAPTLPFAQLSTHAIRAIKEPSNPHSGNSNSRALHIAGHLHANDNGIQASWDLTLTPKALDILGLPNKAPEGARKPTPTQAHEWLGASRMPDLITLGVCGSEALSHRNVADVHRHLDFRHAAFFAGAQGVIAPYARIADLSAARFETVLYRQLKRENTRDAFRETQFALRREHPHPAHWATWALIGTGP